jgi:pSer/pThr/pTyr-binding forkhead associated (FHA) protein
MGLLVFDDGSAFGLDDTYVLGREPESDPAVAAGAARPITLDDPADSVSRVHAEVRVSGPRVELVDRGSTNGTHLWDDDRSVWDRLTPGDPRPLHPGDRGAVGRRTFVFEGLGPTVAPPPSADPALTLARTPAVGALTGPGGVVYPLDRSYVIGRDPLSAAPVREAVASPIVVRDDRQVSRVHAHVSLVDDTVFVRDEPASSGTYVAAPGASDWARIGGDDVELPPGWSLRVGDRVFTFQTLT